MQYGCQPNGSEVEAEAEFGVELARVVEVEAAGGEGVVEQDAAVGYVAIRLR